MCNLFLKAHFLSSKTASFGTNIKVDGILCSRSLLLFPCVLLAPSLSSSEAEQSFSKVQAVTLCSSDLTCSLILLEWNVEQKLDTRPGSNLASIFISYNS